MKKTVYAVFTLLTLICLLSTLCVFAEGIPSDWAQGEIDSAKNLGLITDRVTEDYQRDITREEFCELVVKLYGKISGRDIYYFDDPFTDTDNEEILKAYSLGIVKGVTDDTFSPDSNITREEICVMLTRAVDRAIVGSHTHVYTNNEFADIGKISDWALGSVNYIFDNSIMLGVGGNNIDPQGKTTCEQAVIFIVRLYKNRAKLTDDEYYKRFYNINDVKDDGFDVSSWNGKSLIYKDYENVHSSEYSYCIEAKEADDVRLKKTYEVEKNTSYSVRAYFRTENVVNTESGDLGANISFDSWQNSKVSLVGDNEWTEVGLLINSGENETVTVSFNLGYWYNTCTGKIYIDKIVFEKAQTNVADTNITHIWNWVDVSSVQQFKYMNEGLAYAYLENGKLNIFTPNKELHIDTEYPLLGDVISDNAGNFYAVWGRENETKNNTVETVFISKYTSSGTHLKTTGFVGGHVFGDDGNTKTPFDAGNCSSAMNGDVLIVHYAREMYNGHQSSNVVGVHIANMEPIDFDNGWQRPYCSHSFNQRVIWSERLNSFVYADHGDAYDRAFSIFSNYGKKLVFNFYLEANANYNMGIVNKTFAQLGGLLENGSDIILVGASAKSISEKAKEEKQNLFVQIFDPTYEEICDEMFKGGERRTGAMSFDINDNKNSALTPVTDYGVIWLTDYTDKDVIAPHCVMADGKIVILWNELTNGVSDACYMVLSGDGKIITPKTVLPKEILFNSNEDPVYFGGKVYWAYSYYGIIKTASIEI